MNFEVLLISLDPSFCIDTFQDASCHSKHVLFNREQKNLKRQLLLEDVDDWSKFHITHENIKDHPGRRALEYIGGVDISFVKGDNVNACAAFVVLKLPSLDVVYEDLSMVALTAPYIPGFLAFREADFLVEKIEKLRQLNPHIVPQV